MKIVIVSQKTPIYLHYFLDNLLSELNANGFDTPTFLFLSGMKNKSLRSEVIARYKYYGALQFVKMSLYILTVKVLSYAFLLTKQVKSLDNLKSKYKLSFINILNINSPKSIELLESLKPDILLSIACPQKIGDTVLKICPWPINYHTSLLPKFKGRQPLFWAMHEGKKTTGVTVHLMDECIDTGKIIVQEEYPINSEDTLHTMYYKSMNIGYKLVIQAIIAIRDKNLALIEKNNNEKLYPFPSSKAAAEFRSQGKRFI